MFPNQSATAPYGAIYDAQGCHKLMRRCIYH